MSYELTNDEKIGIVEQHIKNLQYSKFNIEMSLVEESASVPVRQSSVDELELQLINIDAKIASLMDELETLN